MAEARVRLDFTVGVDEYTATRVVRRTRSGGANTAEARLEAAGEVLSGNAEEVTAKVGQLLGLSYEHFTKCVVLPQGEFARFLHDKPRDRQDLLVSLLDLGVYGRMAELSNRRFTDAKARAAVLEGRLGDLAAATPEAIATAAARVKRLTSLVAELDAAVPKLDELNIEVAEATGAAQQLAADATAVGGIRVPDGLDELHDRLTAAAARVADADGEVHRAEAAVASAQAAVLALPDRADLILLREAHDRRATLLERRAKEEVVLAERRSDEAAAGDALATAERGLSEARQAEEAAAAAHRAHAVRADLVVGEPCPVCLREVTTLPETAAAPALGATKQRREKAERQHLGALKAYSAAQQAVTAAVTTVTQVATELEDVEGKLDDGRAREDVVASLDAGGGRAPRARQDVASSRRGAALAARRDQRERDARSRGT